METSFPSGVGSSHQLWEFEANVNTKDLKFDNLASQEYFGDSESILKPKRVLTLGGSTTDPLGTHYSGYKGTWVNHLFEGISNQSKNSFIVVNAGNGASTSSNELLRLITLLHDSKFDNIISFNGVNEIYFADRIFMDLPQNVLSNTHLLRGIKAGKIKVSENRYFLELDFRKLIKNSFLYAYLRDFKNKKTNIPSAKPLSEIYLIESRDQRNLKYGAEKWFYNVRFMHAISESVGSKYIVVLQPTLGISKEYCPTKKRMHD